MTIKKTIRTCITAATLGLLCATANADFMFSDLRNFGGVCTNTQNNRGCDTLRAHTGDDAYMNNGGVDFRYRQLSSSQDSLNYRHVVDFAPSAASIIMATLQLTYAGNQAGEAWYVRTRGDNNPGNTSVDNDSIFLGNLQQTGARWVTQSFNLAPSAFDDVSGSRWILRLRLQDRKASKNSGFRIASSYLSGTYAVPEPGTLALLGLGLVGIGFAKRRK